MTPEAIPRLLCRLHPAIADLSRGDHRRSVLQRAHGREDSLISSEDVMVVPGHLGDTSRRILLVATKPLAKVVHHLRARPFESQFRIVSSNGRPSG